MKRRLVSIPGLILGAIILTALIPIWFPLVILIDLCRRQFRLPLMRLLSFCLLYTSDAADE